jgi:hypothetical protein
MATTDARMGFRLPWSSDEQPSTEEPNRERTPQGAPRAESSAAAGLAQGSRTSPFLENTPMSEGTAKTAANGDPWGAPGGMSGSNNPGAGGRGPSKFMAELTKAMQAAAESAREEAVGRFQAEARAVIEQINGRSSNDSAELRRKAEDDVSGIREWSKVEISRIREETDEKIANRKRLLEAEIEEHAALLERQIEQVHGLVTGYEGQVANFFERLLTEQDPGRFAALAGNLPEPPTLDGLTGADGHNPPVPSRAAVDPWATTERAPERATEPEAPVAAAERSPWGESRNGSGGSSDYARREYPAEREAKPVIQTQTIDAAADAGPWGDPRIAAFRTSPNFAAAEAEAAAAARTADAAEEIPTIGDEALAARLAGLVGAESREAVPATAEPNATQVVVTGLISVASIASFKRQLGRLSGVQSVGVSSGPDGEFVFAVRHSADVVLREAIPALPAFQARVTSASNGNIEVTARDPEA